MIRRATLKPEATPTPVSVAGAKYQCRSCGVTIPELRRGPFVCSYCAGRPSWGKDGYFRDMIVDEIRMMEAAYGQPFSRNNQLAWFEYLSNRAAWETELYERRRGRLTKQ